MFRISDGILCCGIVCQAGIAFCDCGISNRGGIRRCLDWIQEVVALLVHDALELRLREPYDGELVLDVAAETYRIVCDTEELCLLFCARDEFYLGEYTLRIRCEDMRREAEGYKRDYFFHRITHDAT